MASVEKLSIVSIIIYFIIYVIGHLLIAKMLSSSKKELEEKKEDLDIQKKVKILNFLNNWFPAIYVIILFLVLFGI